MTSCLNLRKSIPIIMALICSQRHYRGRSLKLVVRSLGWLIPPHSRKGGDLLGWVSSKCGDGPKRVYHSFMVKPTYYMWMTQGPLGHFTCCIKG